MAELTIRAAVPADVPHLPDVERRAARRFESTGLNAIYDGIVTPLDAFETGQREGRLWVAADGDTRVGFALASQHVDHAHLDEIDVLPEYGRRGIGAALVERVCTWAAEQGFHAVTLSTHVNIAWNAPFYARLGFEILPPDGLTPPLRDLRAREAALGFPVGDRVIMRRSLR